MCDWHVVTCPITIRKCQWDLLLILFELQELLSFLIIKAVYPFACMMENGLCEYILNWEVGEEHIPVQWCTSVGVRHTLITSAFSKHLVIVAQPGLTDPFISILTALNSWFLGERGPALDVPFFLLRGHMWAFWLTFLSLTGVHLPLGPLCYLGFYWAYRDWPRVGGACAGPPSPSFSWVLSFLPHPWLTLGPSHSRWQRSDSLIHVNNY